MDNTFSVIIKDNTGKKVGELPTASNAEILNLINKGFNVVDITTDQEFTQEMVSAEIGVSDGVINLG